MLGKFTAALEPMLETLDANVTPCPTVPGDEVIVVALGKRSGSGTIGAQIVPLQLVLAAHVAVTAGVTAS
ncbi:MAG: hypothetical protein Q8L52_01745 [bacterium]|nr:hypothetical protein [bacterium]